MDSYRIPTKSGASEYVDKRSRFLGLVQPVGSEDEARAVIAACKKQYHDARHNCWCYLLRDGTERYSDDGEPQGTAGIPMLEVFRRAGVTNVVCVVTRYFGGVLLGTGGLLPLRLTHFPTPASRRCAAGSPARSARPTRSMSRCARPSPRSAASCRRRSMPPP